KFMSNPEWRLGLDGPVNVVRRARRYRAAQNDQHVSPENWDDGKETSREIVEDGIHVFVDGCGRCKYDRRRPSEFGEIQSRKESLSDVAVEKFLGAVLHEGHSAGSKRLDQ